MGSVNLGPSVNDRRDLGRRKIGQGEVVGRREGKHIAFTGDRLCLEKE